MDFHEKHQLLKAAFPVDIRTTYGTFDVQYGNVRRANHWNTSWDDGLSSKICKTFALCPFGITSLSALRS